MRDDLMPRRMTTLYEAGGSMAGETAPPADKPRPASEYIASPEPPAGQMPTWAGRRRAGMHMPRWASRLTLIVVDVRVERLQEISRDDAIAEGIVQTWGDWREPPQCFVDENNRYGDASGPHIYDNHTSVENFAILWRSINGPKSWDANPWVAVISFRAINRNIDNLEAT